MKAGKKTYFGLEIEDDAEGVLQDVHGLLKAKKGRGDELASILLASSKILATIKGSSHYVVSRDINDADVIYVTEFWNSKEDHDNSLKNPEVRALISKALPILNESPKNGLEMNVLGGLGLK